MLSDEFQFKYFLMSKYINRYIYYSFPPRLCLSNDQVNAALCSSDRTLLFSDFTIVRSKGSFHRSTAPNELSCLTSLPDNFSLIEPKSEQRLARQWLPDDF